MTWDTCPLPWKQELRIVLTELNKWQKNLSSSPARILNLFLSFTRSSQPLCLSSSHHIHLQLHSVCFSLFSSSWLAFFNFIFNVPADDGSRFSTFQKFAKRSGFILQILRWQHESNMTNVAVVPDALLKDTENCKSVHTSEFPFSSVEQQMSDVWAHNRWTVTSFCLLAECCTKLFTMFSCLDWGQL